MTDAPLLPLSRAQAATLVKALDGAIAPDADEGGGSETLPRVPEKLVRELVRVLREERRGGLPGDEDPAKTARGRALRVGVLGGLAGAIGALPAEALTLIEQARLAAALAPPARSDAQVAADLLVVWGVSGDLARAETQCAGVSDGSLLDDLSRNARDRVAGAIPDAWTPVSTLKFLWAMRGVAKLRDAMPGGMVRNIPIVGAVPGAFSAARDMRAFTSDISAHYSELTAPG